MTQMYPINFAPDSDTAWESAPGTAYDMTGFMPMQRGYYASVAKTGAGSVTGRDALDAYIFRLQSGAKRTFVCRVGDLDEYSAPGAGPTNRGTGYSASTSMWSMAAWGDQIIATNLYDAVQSSTGAGFSALAGSPPNAQFVAASLNFVLLANLSGSPSEVRWSGLRNPATWTSDWRTQCGNALLIETPGPITGAVAYGGGFIVFKSDSMYIGEYVGPAQYVFRWRCVSRRVGCIAARSIAEADGKLYFLSSTGVWEFDGQSLRNVSLGVWKAFQAEVLDVSIGIGSRGPDNTGTFGLGLHLATASVDDVEGIYTITLYRATNATPRSVSARMWALNVRTGRWGRVGQVAVSNYGSGTSYYPPVMIKASTSDSQGFFGNYGRDPITLISNAYSGGSTFQKIDYPGSPTISDSTFCGALSMSFGPVGSLDGSAKLTRVYPGLLNVIGATVGPFTSGEAYGYADSAQLTQTASATLVGNAALGSVDGVLSAKYVTFTINAAEYSMVAINKIGVDYRGGGKK